MLCMCVHTCVCMCVCACVHGCVRTHVHVYMRTCVCVFERQTDRLFQQINRLSRGHMQSSKLCVLISNHIHGIIPYRDKSHFTPIAVSQNMNERVNFLSAKTTATAALHFRTILPLSPPFSLFQPPSLQGRKEKKKEEIRLYHHKKRVVSSHLCIFLQRCNHLTCARIA